MDSSMAGSLIRLARESISSELDGTEIQCSDSGEKKGVFVTLTMHGELRGCIGFPEPVFPLEKGVFEAARAAAFRDPRFPPVSIDELGEICIEVSVLTPPEKISSVEGIIVGRSGLMVSKGNSSGLLLPQVAVEHGWDREEFLEHASMKAGLGQDGWRGAEIRVFECEVFREKSPGGEVFKAL